MQTDTGGTLRYVPDTHALYWYWNDHTRLGAAGIFAFRLMEERRATGIVPLIVLAELQFLTAKLGGALSAEELLRLVDRAPSLRIEAITRRHLLAFDQLSGIPEMHDRFIAAVALQLGAPVITRDRLLSDHPLIQTIW